MQAMCLVFWIYFAFCFSSALNVNVFRGSLLTSWDLEVWATKPPPWKWIIRKGDEGRRLAFRPSDREMAPPSERDRDSRVSLSWRRQHTISKRGMRYKVRTHSYQSPEKIHDSLRYLHHSDNPKAVCNVNKSLLSLLIYSIAIVTHPFFFKGRIN